MELFSLALSLFLLMDPMGNIPLFIAILKELDPDRQRKVILRELLIALVTIFLFYFIGSYLLGVLQITQETIMISGGIILFLISLKLIFPTNHSDAEFQADKEPFIVPLAIPLIAGPAVLAAVMLYSKQGINPWIVSGAILIAWIASTIILLASSFLKRILGDKGIRACERLMGLLLIMLAVQMFLNGWKNL